MMPTSIDGHTMVNEGHSNDGHKQSLMLVAGCTCRQNYSGRPILIAVAVIVCGRHWLKLLLISMIMLLMSYRGQWWLLWNDGSSGGSACRVPDGRTCDARSSSNTSPPTKQTARPSDRRQHQPSVGTGLLNCNSSPHVHQVG